MDDHLLPLVLVDAGELHATLSETAFCPTFQVGYLPSEGKVTLSLVRNCFQRIGSGSPGLDEAVANSAGVPVWSRAMRLFLLPCRQRLQRTHRRGTHVERYAPCETLCPP